MKLNEFLQQRATDGIGLLQEFHELMAESSLEEVAMTFGYRIAELKQYARAWKLLCHPRIRAAARDAHLSLTVLLDLTHAAYPLRQLSNRVDLLVQLCSLLAGLSADDAKIRAVTTVREWEGNTTKRLNTAVMHKTVGRDGKRRLTAAFGVAEAARIDTVLHDLCTQLRKADPALSYDQAYAQALVNKITSTGPSENPQPFAPMFLIATDCHFHADGTIATTDGALVDLRELVDEHLAATGWAAVIGTTDETIYPTVGALVKVNNRFATAPQRLVAVMETLMCSWPGCDQPAAKCQIHHILAHKHGGESKNTNFAPACAHHNGRNDDHPDVHNNGRIEKDASTGRPGYRRKPDHELTYNTHPITQKGTAAYIQHAYRL